MFSSTQSYPFTPIRKWFGVFAILLPSTVHAQLQPVVIAPRSSKVRPIVLQAQPLFDIGGTLTDPDLEFNHANGFLRGLVLTNGSIAANDVWRVRIYNRAGVQTSVTGKSAGSGPNEFRNIWRMCVTRGDTLIVSDVSTRRISVVTSLGTIVRQFQITDGTMTNDACLADGTFLVTKSNGDSANRRMGDVLRYRTDGSVAGNSGRFPIAYTTGTPAQISLIAAADRFILADPTSPEISVFSTNGTRIRTFRLSDKQREMSAAEIADETPRPEGENRKATESSASSKAFNKWPLYRRLEVDPAGNIWLQDMTKSVEDPQSWVRINPLGQVTGRLDLPVEFHRASKLRTRVVAFVNDGILIRFHDSDGAAHLKLFQFR